VLQHQEHEMDNTSLETIILRAVDKTGGLPKELTILIVAKVTLRKNIHVRNGLVNGAMVTY